MRNIICGKFIAVTTIFIGLTASCFSGQAEKIQTTSPVLPTPTNIPSPDIKEVQSSKGGRRFIRGGEGWAIPQISWEKGKKTTKEMETEDKRKIKTDLTEVDVRPFLVTAEPFVSIGENIGKVQIQTARQFAIHNQAFCYKFLVNRVEIDDQTNAVRSSSGSVFFFAYYDEDGDGSFETLYLDEIGKLGVPSFYDLPHIPAWILQKN